MPTPTHRSRKLPSIDIADGWLQVMSTHHHSPREDVHPSVAAERPFDLVLLDMDGTLTSGLSSWEMIHHEFGVTNSANWERYARGEIDDHEFMRSDIELWCLDGRKVHVEDVERIMSRVALMPHARELVAELKKRGIATCILSGGLDVLAHRVAVECGIDMFVANGLALDEEGYLAGHGICYVKVNDKGAPAREIVRKLGVSRERTAAVGNSVWDVPMFRETGRGIAFAPVDEGVRKGADAVVEGTDMLACLPHLTRA